MLIIGLLGPSVQVPHLKVTPVRVSRTSLSQWPTSMVADGPSRHLKEAMRQAGGSERSTCPAQARSGGTLRVGCACASGGRLRPSPAAARRGSGHWHEAPGSLAAPVQVKQLSFGGVLARASSEPATRPINAGPRA